MALVLGQGDGHDIGDVFHVGVALQYIEIFAQSHKQRSDGFGPAQSIHQLVSHVTRNQIGEDQHVGCLSKTSAISSARMAISLLIN